MAGGLVVTSGQNMQRPKQRKGKMLMSSRFSQSGRQLGLSMSAPSSYHRRRSMRADQQELKFFLDQCLDPNREIPPFSFMEVIAAATLVVISQGKSSIQELWFKEEMQS
jgi:hypothetical protein